MTGPRDYVIAAVTAEADAQHIARAVRFAGDYDVEVVWRDSAWYVIAYGQCVDGTEEYFHGWRAAWSYALVVGGLKP